MTVFTTLSEVKASVGLEPADTADDALVQAAVDAANTWATALPDAPLTDADPLWPRFELGVKLLAARWYKRRFTPEGVGAFGETPLYVARRDPDVDQLLQLGPYAKPRVG